MKGGAIRPDILYPTKLNRGRALTYYRLLGTSYYDCVSGERELKFVLEEAAGLKPLARIR